MKLRNKKTGEIKEYTHTMTSYHVPIKGGYEIFTPWKPEEWEEIEDVKEPLIKDEKIRRELSEWIALYGEHEKIKYFRYNDFVVFRLCRERGTLEPEISLPVKYDCDSLREGKEYTKPVLCGEEENE